MGTVTGQWRQFTELEDELPPELLQAMGRMATWFAALEGSLVLLLAETNESASLDRLARLRFSDKLRKVSRELESRNMVDRIPIERIEKLVETRHDLMHGIVYQQIFSVDENSPEFTVSNLGSGAYYGVDSTKLDEISEEVRSILESVSDVQSELHELRVRALRECEK